MDDYGSVLGTGFFLGVVLCGCFFIFLIMGVPKDTCEEVLPRTQSCVMVYVPEQEEKEDGNIR